MTVRESRTAAALGLLAMLSACGGDGGTSIAANTPTAPTTATTPPAPPPPTQTAASSGCSLAARQNFAFATLKENYLFPETLPAALDPAPYTTVSDYLDALTATARSQGRDRFFTYLTSIASENAFFSSGASAGFGFRLVQDSSTGRIFVAEAFEGAPALAAGIDRGTEILAVGNDANSLQTVAALGGAGFNSALGDNSAGVSRTFKVQGTGGAQTVTVTKTNYSLDPVSARYGAKTIVDNGRKVGYLNLRTFITSAEPELRTAFANFRSQGITNFIVDLRYNGGGLVSTAELMADLMGGNRSTSDVFDNVTFRPEKASNNTTKRFAPQPQSVSPVKIAFIGTGGTASASELLINGFIPFYGTNEALVGTNTFGKPVGQIAVDNASCDDRVRVIAFSLRNGANSDAYFNGLASSVKVSCKAADDVTKPLGDPAEASTRQALDYLNGATCTPITASGVQTSRSVQNERLLLSSTTPSASQREVPGSF